MKTLYIAIMLFVMVNPLTAQEQSPTEILTASIQKQIIEATGLIDEVGRDRISDHYFQKLNESQAALAQFKANPDSSKASLVEVNGFYQKIENILKPESSLKNKVYSDIIESSNRGDNSGSIRGLIRDSNGDIVNYGNVRLYNSSGDYSGYSSIDNIGRYIFNNVPAGQYAIIFNSFSNELIDTAYPSNPCPNGLGSGCQISALNLINFEDGNTLENINIVALRLPTISGKILDSNDSAISSVNVLIYDSEGDYIRYVRTDSQGMYTIAAPELGEYYLTFSHSSYQLELYNNIICYQECDFNSGSAIFLNYNQNLQNINANLQKNAVISGSVIEADTSSPITNSSVYIVNGSGSVVEQVNVTSTHLWEVDVRAGDYYIIGSDRYNNTDNYLATKYPNNTCFTSHLSSCDDINGTVISHSTTDTNNIVLERSKGARIRGAVTDLNGQPLSGVTIQIFYSFNLDDVGYDYFAYTDEFGQFSSFQLGNSDYYIVAGIESHLVQLFSNVNCTYEQGCDFDSGTAITINNLNDVNGINFQLTPKSTISGTIVDQNDSPLNNIYVTLRDELNYQYSSYTFTNEDGGYEFNNIPAGNDYKLSALNLYERSLYSEVYNDIQCNNNDCANEAYTPIELTSNQQLTIDFDLNYKGKVNLDLISNSSNQVENGSIYAVDLQGNVVASFSANSNGFLHEGDYYFYYQSSNSYYDYSFVSKVYGGINCMSVCDASTGTLIHVSNNTEQSLTMHLDQYFYLEVTSSPDYAEIRLVEENLSNFSGRQISGVESITINNMSNKYLKVSKTGYFSQLYNGINCEESVCDITQGDLIVPMLNASINIDFNLTPLTSLSGVITDQNNNPIADKTVRLLREVSSYSSWTTTTNANGEYTFGALDAGDYYLRVNVNDYSNEFDEYVPTYYGNIPCDVSDCNDLGINPITINVSDYLTGYDIQMFDRGTISGEGIKNIFDELGAVRLNFFRVEDDSLDYIIDVSIENGILTPFHLPEGEYKLIAQLNNQILYTAYPSTLCENNSREQCAAVAESLYISNGNNTHFSSFILHQYGVLNVKLMNSNDDTPIYDGKVDIYKSNGEFVRTYSIGSSNNEMAISLADSGLYKAFIYDSNYSGQSKYIAQIYNGVDCEDGIGFDCLFSQGQDFSVENDSVYSISAHLKPKPRLKVNVINEITNKQIADSRINIFDSFGNIVWTEYNPNLGESHYIDILGVGDYYALVYSNIYSSTTAYPNIICEDINDLDSCEVGLATFSLQQGDNPKQINIRTTLLQGVNGYVLDATTSQPLENVIIDFWNSSGNHRGSDVSTSNGGFSKPFSSGDYYLSTDTNNAFINEVYQNIQCQRAAIIGDCDVTRGMLINIPSNNSLPIIIDFELAKDPIFGNGFE